MKQEAENWWRSARSDLETARYNLDGERLSAAAFYAQQATEKALKSLQIVRLRKFQKTHDLVLLAKSVDAPREIMELCEIIGPFYTVTRYPDVRVPYDKDTVRSVLQGSVEVLEWARDNLT